MSVEQKQFLGYAQVNSDIKPINEFPELSHHLLSTPINIKTLSAFKIKWITKFFKKKCDLF
jgi:hypothetical protein